MTSAEKLLKKIQECGYTDELRQEIEDYFVVPVFQVGNRVCSLRRNYRLGVGLSIGVVCQVIRPDLIEVEWHQPGSRYKHIHRHHPKSLRVATEEDENRMKRMQNPQLESGVDD